MKTTFLRLGVSVLLMATTANAMLLKVPANETMQQKIKRLTACSATSFKQKQQAAAPIKPAKYVWPTIQFKQPTPRPITTVAAKPFGDKNFPKDLIAPITSYHGTSNNLYQSIKDLVQLRRVNKTLLVVLTGDKILQHVKNYKEIIERNHATFTRSPFNNSTLILSALERLLIGQSRLQSINEPLDEPGQNQMNVENDAFHYTFEDGSAHSDSRYNLFVLLLDSLDANRRLNGNCSITVGKAGFLMQCWAPI